MKISEPQPLDPDWPRYSNLRFPPYRYVPGLTPHPRNHPEGHSFEKEDEPVPSWEPQDWWRLVPYLYGVDLYNYSYWWECHESFEQLWRAVDRQSAHALYIQGLIQLSAANLHRHLGRGASSAEQARRGLVKLENGARGEAVYMGLNVSQFVCASRGYFLDHAPGPALIKLILLE